MKLPQLPTYKCILLLLHVPVALGFLRLDLTGNGWVISEELSGIHLTGKVPGTPYTALLDQGLIENPLYRDNDVKLKWLGATNWTYTTNFTAPAIVVSSNRVMLICEGLDTIATVSLNGKIIGQADNMFIQWRYDISGMLQRGNNNLRVDFTSAVLVAKTKANNSEYIIPPDCPPSVQHGECHVNQLRKEQCSFSWDWGPSFPTQGIWKPIYIDSFKSAVMRDLSAVVSKKNDQWSIAVETYFDVIQGSGIKGQLHASIADLNLTYTQSITVSSAQSSHKFTIAIPKTTVVPLWWPNGYGDQPLFTLNAAFLSGRDNTSRSLRIGFRTVELVQVPVKNETRWKRESSYFFKPRASSGLTFYFKVNGMPIFLKGSNWIPADSFQERVTRDRLQYLLSSAANVSINSMRVWGGGIYESDDLYDICDELGILVWQDLMFSVALYPAYPQFLESVSEEVQHQVRRLKHHASILVWAGNNENEKALRQDWFNIKQDFTRYYNDYIELYVTTIKPIIEFEDPSRDYLSSSPTDGAESVKQGYVAQDPGSELYGDIHFYDYMADQWDASVFRIPRMASEYGIQSWCNNASLARVFLPADFDVNSKMVEHRQHHAMGNLEMTAEVGMHLQMPTSPDPQEYFAEFIYLTQINQAMSMRTQTEHYRRYQSRLLKDGRGLTMGALYWQLNDIWQAPTWASIDYEGRWKMLHYFAQSFFSKHLISPYKPDPDTLDVFIVVDEIPAVERRRPGSGSLSFQPMTRLDDILSSEVPLKDMFSILLQVRTATVGHLNLDMYQYSSFKPLFSWTVPYQLTSTAESVFTKSTKELLTDSGCPGPQHCLLHFTATDQMGSTLSTSWHMFTYPKYAILEKANLKIQNVTKRDATVFDLVVSADAPALFVWLCAGDIQGHFSDNGFHMLKPSLEVRFFARQATTVSRLMSQLSVRSVVNRSDNRHGDSTSLKFDAPSKLTDYLTSFLPGNVERWEIPS